MAVEVLNATTKLAHPSREIAVAQFFQLWISVVLDARTVDRMPSRLQCLSNDHGITAPTGDEADGGKRRRQGRADGTQDAQRATMREGNN